MLLIAFRISRSISICIGISDKSICQNVFTIDGKRYHFDFGILPLPTALPAAQPAASFSGLSLSLSLNAERSASQGTHTRIECRPQRSVLLCETKNIQLANLPAEIGTLRNKTRLCVKWKKKKIRSLKILKIFIEKVHKNVLKIQF